MNILDEIAAYKKELLLRQKKILPFSKLKESLSRPYLEPRFQKKIAQKGTHLIAEVKKASPSAGILCADFDYLAIAKSYEKGGAACLSILTEDRYFKGELSFLDHIGSEVLLPLLRKDFIIDEYQIYESKAHGADAILLITALLDQKTLCQFLKVAEDIKLDALVEVHDTKELARAFDAGAVIIGINARDLKDFKVDLKIVPLLMKKIPSGMLVVAESGIRTKQDIDSIKALGVNAVLVGEALMREENIEQKTREFVENLS